MAKSVLLNVRVTKAQAAAIRDFAKASGITVSDFLRRVWLPIVPKNTGDRNG